MTRDRGRGRHVERGEGAPHGNPYQCVAALLRERGEPRPSAPSTSTSGSVANGTSVRVWSPSPSRPMHQTSARLARSSAAGMPPTNAMGTYSIAPAAVLAAVALTGALRCFGITMPVTPAVSAARTIAPRLRGSVTPSSATRNARGSASAHRGRQRNGSARANTLRRVGLRGRAQALGRHHPQLRSGCRDDLVDRLVALDALRHPHAAHLARAGPQQLEHRAPAFDLLAADLVGPTLTGSLARGVARRTSATTAHDARPAAVGLLRLPFVAYEQAAYHGRKRPSGSLTGARWCRRSRPRA